MVFDVFSILLELGVYDEMNLLCGATFIWTKHDWVRRIAVELFGSPAGFLRPEVLQICATTFKLVVEARFELKNNCTVVNFYRLLQLLNDCVLSSLLAYKKTIIIMSLALWVIPYTWATTWMNQWIPILVCAMKLEFAGWCITIVHRIDYNHEMLAIDYNWKKKSNKHVKTNSRINNKQIVDLNISNLNTLHSQTQSSYPQTIDQTTRKIPNTKKTKELALQKPMESYHNTRWEHTFIDCWLGHLQCRKKKRRFEKRNSRSKWNKRTANNRFSVCFLP